MKRQETRIFARITPKEKALITVISDIFATLTETALNSNHFVLGVMLGTVNARHIHRLVGLFIVFNVTARRIKILIQVSFVGCFVRVISVVDNFL